MAPKITTNKNGEATVDYFCSDVNSCFLYAVEGVGQQRLLGKKDFHFIVIKGNITIDHQFPLLSPAVLSKTV
ncbi:hypothetical protein [Mucilaginibacter sp. SJ]|uniref:hypothetical protein n=1 Tax=Mucilaginibacter sp. SJ TaxID=3029053 RepID=UPI0023A9BD77|nr:hypothetical protein [Mucilaginibacter sp. SJ]WEA00576.1 hypothetical protein MusilaSJ_24275 [Mucilaginibacter sp. SJ]